MFILVPFIPYSFGCSLNLVIMLVSRRSGGCILLLDQFPASASIYPVAPTAMRRNFLLFPLPGYLTLMQWSLWKTAVPGSFWCHWGPGNLLGVRQPCNGCLMVRLAAHGPALMLRPPFSCLSFCRNYSLQIDVEREFLKGKENNTLISSKYSKGLVSQVLLIQKKKKKRMSGVGSHWGISEQGRHYILSSSFKLVGFFFFF